MFAIEMTRILLHFLASLLNGIELVTTNSSIEEFHDYLYLRKNPSGEHKELWYHEQGDRSWLVVTRDTNTHVISRVELVSDFLKRKVK